MTFNGTAELDGKFSITGGTGDDTLTGGDGADTISGGAGLDSLVGGAGADSLTGGADVDTISGGAGADTIDGGAGADVITGGDGADSIAGAAGADRITGGAAADALSGGADADTFVYTNAAVADSNTATFDSISDWTSAADKLEVTLNYSAIGAAITVNATLVTAAAGLTLAQAALSTERGQYIYDTDASALYINVNNDNIISTLDFKIGLNAASTASATVADGDINFIITGTAGADTITAGGGADTIDGGVGADSIVGGAGADSITAGTGADTITGGAGADTIVLGASGQIDTVIFSTAATNGADTITGFILSEDFIDVELLAGGNVTAETAVAANASAVSSMNGRAVVFADGSDGTGSDAASVIVSWTDLADVAAFLDAGIVQGNSESYVIVINDLVGDLAYVYNVTTTSAGVLGASEVTLMGTISGFTGAFTVTETIFTA